MELAPQALVALMCRTWLGTPTTVGGVEELAALVAKRLGAEPRIIGSPVIGETPAGYEDDLAVSRGCLLEAGGQLEDAVGGGRVPVLLAGDSAISLTTLPSLARVHPEAKVLYLDAHGGYATPAVDSDGSLRAMALAGACGEWDPELGIAPIDPARVVLCGAGQLPGPERELLERSAVTVIGASLETLVFTQNALDGVSVFVHVDLNVLDGIPADKLYDLLEAVSADCDVVGVEVTGFDAPEDPLERQAAASNALHAVEPLLESVTRAGASA